MHRLTTDLIGRACKVFLPLAYPDGDAAIPAKKRCFLCLPADADFFAQLAATPAIGECCQVVRRQDRVQALLIRLGSRHYPHLKMKVQLLDHEQGDLWLFSVDTHDAFSKTAFLPPRDHPEAAAWMLLQTQNAAIKERIEAALEQAGLETFNSLLRRDLGQQQCRASFA